MKKQIFRNLLSSNDIVCAAGVHDALSARIAQHVGFKAIYMTGNGSMASLLGMPDLGVATMSEMVERARQISDSVGIPILSDADTGYGGPLNIKRTVESFSNADIAGIHIEDQILPKRCGALGGVKVLDIKSACGRIEAALKARKDPDFFIIARTDAKGPNGIQDALMRVKEFSSLGVDAVMVEGLTSLDEIEQVATSSSVPVLYNIYETSTGDAYSINELKNVGVKIAINCLTSTLVCARALLSLYTDFFESGHTKSYVSKMMKMDEYVEILGIKTETEFEVSL